MLSAATSGEPAGGCPTLRKPYTPHGHFTITERVFERSHDGFYGGSIVVWGLMRHSTLLAAQRTVQILLREPEDASRQPLQGLDQPFSF